MGFPARQHDRTADPAKPPAHGGATDDAPPNSLQGPPDMSAELTPYKVFEAGDVALQCGITLRDAKLAYATYGR